VKTGLSDSLKKTLQQTRDKWNGNIFRNWIIWNFQSAKKTDNFNEKCQSLHKWLMYV